MHELQRRMTAREFQEWVEYFRLEPWGQDWLQTGVIAAATVNTWSKRKVRPERFIPRAIADAPRQDARALEAQLQHFAAMHNARIEKHEREQQQKPQRVTPPSRKPKPRKRQ